MEALVLAVHPYLPTDEVMTRFAPLAKALGRALGTGIEVQVAADYAKHIEAVGRDRVQLAYLGPVQYVQVVARYGTKPLLARQEVGHRPWLHGEIVVRDDSPIRNVAELRGKRFAFGDRNSTMAHVVPMQMLELAGVTQDRLAGFEFLGAHRNVALAVIEGRFDAGAIKKEVFDEYAAQGLRSIAPLPAMPDHLFVGASTLPEAEVRSARALFTSLHHSPEGRDIITAIHPGMTALVPVEDFEYGRLRSLMGLAAVR